MSQLHVLFRVGDADYVVASDRVAEMESYVGATRVPGALPHVVGVVQIRGKVLPLIDLRVRFGLPAIERGLNSRIVVVLDEGRRVGLLVDEAREVVRIGAEAFRPPPDVVAEQAAGFVDSIAQVGTRLVMRIDVRRVVEFDQITIPKELSDAAQVPV